LGFSTIPLLTNPSQPPKKSGGHGDYIPVKGVLTNV